MSFECLWTGTSTKSHELLVEQITWKHTEESLVAHARKSEFKFANMTMIARISRRSTPTHKMGVHR